ncbi:PD40 domain-containing protein, partial [candidate division KSB1 bacterium]|nr:PD40 domain-containing protein [candidate division KSB1 bacterium]
MLNYFRIIVTVAFLLISASTTFSQTVAENDSSAKKAKADKTLPLITTRTLEFTAEEGTWISLDLLPDGSTILFELLGDFYTMPISGGKATRITEGQAYDMQPRYSPDGTQITFVSDRNGSENLWIANADGTDPKAITTGEKQSYMSPIWEPDGDYLIAVKGTQLWLYHKDGGSGVQITGHREEGGPTPPAHIGPAFGNDSRYLWVNLRGNLGGGFALAQPKAWDFSPEVLHSRRSTVREVGAFQIGLLDRETGRVMVRTHESIGAFRPVPSPDGRWLVYATRYEAREVLKLLDLTSGEQHW